MQRFRVLLGVKPLLVINQDTLLVSRTNKLYIYSVKLDTFEYIAQVKMSPLLHIASYFSLLKRLLRIEFRYAFNIDNNNCFLLFKSNIYKLNIQKKDLSEEALPSRPLYMSKFSNIDNFDDLICFGEYKSNLTKEAINIWAYKDNQWNKIFTFKEGNIDHVHNIIPDYYRNCAWILSGDFEQGAAIWIAKNNFQQVEPFVRGEQKYRSCIAFPTTKGLLYMTDSQIEENKIFLLNVENEKQPFLLELATVNGSVIYGGKYKDNYVFSTTIEPYFETNNKLVLLKNLLKRKRGQGIKSNYSEIYLLDDNYKLNLVQANKKDKYPFIFQFGASLFPTDLEKSDYFIFYNIALENNNLSTEIWR